MDKEKFLKSRNVLKNYHIAILFSMLNPNHETSSPDLLKDFLNFVKISEQALDSLLSDFDFLEFSCNIKQTILLIKNKEHGILIENNLDCEKNDKELKRCFDKCLTGCCIKPPMIVSINWEISKEPRQLPSGIKKIIHNIIAKELADFFSNWCEKQSEESLAKGILTQYVKKLQSISQLK